MPYRAKTPPPAAAEGVKSTTRLVRTSLLSAVLIGAVSAGGLTGCSSSNGGSNGHGDRAGTGAGVVNPNASGGLVFSYPIDGQQYVYPGTHITFAFDADASGNVKLVNTDTGATVATKLVSRGNGIFNLYVTDSDGELSPSSHYAVEAEGSIGGGNTRFSNGQTLFAFTTEAGPGAPSATTFTIVNHPSGANAGFPVQGLTLPFTQFNPIRARFSQPVDVGSVKLCTGDEKLGDDNCTVSVTGPNGNVAGRLTVLGKNLVFAPGTGHPDPANQNASQYDGEDFAANSTYTVTFGGGFQSATGQTLADNSDSFSVTPISISTGNNGPVVQRLKIGAVSGGTSPLTGGPANNVDIGGQLIGSYDLAAVPSPSQGGLQVRLAAFASGQKYDGTSPALLPAGQSFYLQNFDLKLGSQLQSNGTYSRGQVDTPLQLDDLNVQIADGSDVYLQANQLRNVVTPIRVTQRLDLNIYGVVPSDSTVAGLSNGVVNQTVLNVVASGIAVPEKNGDISLSLYGSFPISVNQDGQASVNFELELTLPASRADQPAIYAQASAPRITGQFPSACLHTYALDNFDSGSKNGLTPISLFESNCDSLLDSGTFTFPGTYATYAANAAGFINPDGTTATPVSESQYLQLLSQSVPTTVQKPYAKIQATSAPSITFSQPIDPASLAGNVTLTQVSAAGNASASGNASEVPVRFEVDGTSVVVYPVNGLKPGTVYSLTVGNGVTNLAGVGLSGTYNTPIQFETYPVVDGDESIVRQNAPFITGISVGLPCTLKDGDFTSGGDIAGRCFGDVGLDSGSASSSSGSSASSASSGSPPQAPARLYQVFSQPANQPIEVAFNKEVQQKTVKLAGKCLIGGTNGQSASGSGASIALQIMSKDACEGTVPATIAYVGSRVDSHGTVLTRGFSIQPQQPLKVGQRYWLVLCGSVDPNPASSNGSLPTPSNQPSDCSSGATIIGRDGYALNTDPLANTGTRPSNNSPNASGFEIDHGAGGADLIMPFDATGATSDYASMQLTSPVADTNGNGFFDAPPTSFSGDGPTTIAAAGTVTSYGAVNMSPSVYNDKLGQELPTPQNRLLSSTAASFGGPFNFTGPSDIAYISGAVPIQLLPAGKLSDQCSAALTVKSNGQAVVKSSDGNCVPVELKPGALLAVTNFNAGGSVATGRTLLRFPDQFNGNGNDSGTPQEGYIVPSCSGTLNGNAFSYSPCFVANLTVTANVLGALGEPKAQVDIPQQNLNVQLVGPVAFQQNGQLTIASTNVNTFTIQGQIFGGFAQSKTEMTPGEQTLQLVGPAIHGGEPFLK